MKIVIIYPREFFSDEQLAQLGQYDLQFLEGKNLNLDQLETLYEGKEMILSPNPEYIQDGWHSLSVERVARMKNLKAICLSTTSFSWVEIEKLRNMGIIVTNTPDKSTNAVAEFNLLMMFSLLRKLPLIIKNNWRMDYDNFLAQEARNLTAGIIGLGKIGQRVAELCTGLGMKVTYWNRGQKDLPYESATLENLFANSDVIFNTIATAPSLTGFLNKELISKLKRSSMIVSTSDIHVFDEQFILEQIKNDKLAGYAFEDNNHKITDYEGNVMVFPAQAYFTKTTAENTARIVTETILSIIKGNPINKVN